MALKNTGLVDVLKDIRAPKPKYPYTDKAIERLTQGRSATINNAAANIGSTTNISTPIDHSARGNPKSFVNRTMNSAKATAAKARNFINNKPTKNMGFVRRNLNKAAGTKAGGFTIGALLGKTAYDVYNTPTRDYRQRFGLNPHGSVDSDLGQAVLDTGVRTLGAASDIGDNLGALLNVDVSGNLYRDKLNKNSNGSVGLISDASAEPGGNIEGDYDIGNTQATPEQRVKGIYNRAIDDSSYVPEKGTGLMRNNSTGEITAFDSRGKEKSVVATQEPTAEEFERVQVPNAALAMDVDSMPAFLRQLTRAQQTNVDNASRQGFVNRRLKNQEVAEGDLKLKQKQQLQSVFETLSQLSDENDPTGQERGRLNRLALSLQGKSPKDNYQLKLAYGEPNEFGEQEKRLIKYNAKTGEHEFVDVGKNVPRGTPSDADLEYTAQLHGISVDEVKQQLEIQ